MSEQSSTLHKKILISTVFAVSMAYLESAVVVYLRELFQADGFPFPLHPFAKSILYTEIGREAATIVMLYSYARTIGQNRRETFAFFALNFGIWDIWYYIWLKILVSWPASLLDWDILFLIPVPWLGPVLAPVLVSLALIMAALVILYMERSGKYLSMRPVDWLLEAVAGIVIIGTFISEPESLSAINPPGSYSWWVFAAGLGGGLLIFILRILQSYRTPAGER